MLAFVVVSETLVQHVCVLHFYSLSFTSGLYKPLHIESQAQRQAPHMRGFVNSDRAHWDDVCSLTGTFR